MFNQTNASAADDFKKTQEGYVEQLISNFELRLLPLGKARQAVKELGGPDWPRGNSLVDGGELLEHCSEPGCAPGLAKWSAEDGLHDLISDEGNVHLEVGGASGSG